MTQTLAEYAEWLAEQPRRWPVVPPREPVHAAPYARPLPGVKAIAWDVYGTLLRITDGELLFQHPQPSRMIAALRQTAEEFQLEPALPYPLDSLQSLYDRTCEALRVAGSRRRGDLTEIDTAEVWRQILGRLDREKWEVDRGRGGDLKQLAEKMALFFQQSLQGIEAAVGTLPTLQALADAGIVCGLVADGQRFTEVQMLRALKQQGTLPPAARLWHPDAVTLSARVGIRKPSRSLYLQAIEQFASLGLEPANVLYVGARLREDLTVAKSLGFRTVLFAGDRLSLRAAMCDLRDPVVKPDRLITEVPQILEILSL